METQVICASCDCAIVVDSESSKEYRIKEHLKFDCELAKEAKHLPAGLHNWFMANRLAGTNLIYAKSAEDQIMFVRDTLSSLFLREDIKSNFTDKFNSEDWYKIRLNTVKVIGTHRSKSCKLPVYEISFVPGNIITMRNNFYDWKVSVDSEKEINIEYAGLFNPDASMSSVCFEGFPEDRCFGPYSNNKKQFSVEIFSEYALWAFLWQIANCLRTA